MVRRRSASGTHDPRRAQAGLQDSLAYLTGRFDALDERLGRIENDVAEGALGQERLRSEMAESRRDVGELRDGFQMLRDQVEKMPAEQSVKVAEGAAHGAAQAVAETSAPVTAKAVTQSVKGLFQRWGAIGALGAGVVWLFSEGPTVVRGLEAFWNMLKGLNP